MSLSDSSTFAMHRKCTLSEHATENGDPLVVKKKVREAAKIAKKKHQVFFKKGFYIKKTYCYCL